MTNMIADITYTNHATTAPELARGKSNQSPSELMSLDSAELSLVGGGGAHGGNALSVDLA